jgi:hypothetical protein
MSGTQKPLVQVALAHWLTFVHAAPSLDTQREVIASHSPV